MDILPVLSGPLIGFTAVALGGGGGLCVGSLTAGFHVLPAVAVSTSLATIVSPVLIGGFSHWRSGLHGDVGSSAYPGRRTHGDEGERVAEAEHGTERPGEPQASRRHHGTSPPVP